MENAETTVSPQPSQKSSIPTVAGILLIIAGILGLLTWIVVAFIGGIFGAGISMIPGADITGAEWIVGILVVCGIIGIIFAIIALLGGVMSIQKKNWGFALVGGILGLFTIGPYFISSILALVGLILVAISRQEFQ